MQIRLDPAALAALFPEGTEARVELQNAVVVEFVKKNLKWSAIPPEIKNEIACQARDASTAALREAGVLKDAWGHQKLSPELKSEIFLLAKSAVGAEIREIINAAVESIRGTIQHNTQAAVNRLVDSEIRDAVKSRVASVVVQLSAGG